MTEANKMQSTGCPIKSDSPLHSFIVISITNGNSEAKIFTVIPSILTHILCSSVHRFDYFVPTFITRAVNFISKIFKHEEINRKKYTW